MDIDIGLCRALYCSDHDIPDEAAAALRLAISIPVCALAGVAFYKIENPVTQWLTGKLKTAAKH